jgi:hypothetical protein
VGEEEEEEEEEEQEKPLCPWLSPHRQRLSVEAALPPAFRYGGRW